MAFPSKFVARAGIMVAVSVALGWLTIAVPNVELITASIFIAGYLLGPWWGLIVGVVAEGLFSLSNPVGIPMPPLLVAQCIGMAFAGLVGGWIGQRWRNDFPAAYPVMLGGVGLLVTVIFDVLTTLSFPIAVGLPLSEIWKVLIMGIPFSLVHWVSNVVIFVVIVPLVLRRLPQRYRHLKTVAAGCVILLLGQSVSAQDIPQEIVVPIPPDTQQVVTPDSLISDSLEVDSLAVDTVAVLPALLDTLPSIENIFEPVSDDTLAMGRRIHRVQYLEPGIEDMGDVLRYFPYTYPHDMATYGAFSGMSVQGQSPRRSVYSLDGRTLNHRRNGTMDLNEISVEEIEEISVGPPTPGSEPPSTGGMFGFRSLLPMADVPFSRIALRAGYYGFTTLDFHVAQKIYGNWYTNIVGQAGYFEDRGDSTEVESVQFRSHVTYKPTPLWTGRLSYYHYRAKNNIPYPMGHHKSLRNDLVLSLVRRLSADKEPRLELQSWVTDIHQNDLDIFHEGERRAGGQLRAVTSICSTGSIWAGVFGEGWEIKSEDDSSQPDHELRAFGGASVPVISGLSLHSSALYSRYDSGVQEPAGEASIEFQPFSWIRLRGGGEWSFRAPSYFEQFGHGRLDLRDDLLEPVLRFSQYDTLLQSDDIDPEKSQTYSGGVDVMLPWSFRLSVGAYQKEVTDPIVFREVSDGYVQAQNGEKTTWQGGQVTARWAVWDSLELSGSWSVNDAIDDPDNTVPGESGWAAITYRHTYFKDDLRVLGRVEGVYWGERTLNKYLRSYTLPEVTVINFRISATIKDVTMFWGMNNLLSEEYELLGGFPMIHREEVYGIRWNFLD